MSDAKKFRHSGEQDSPPYHYTECGLDDVYLLSGYEIEQTPHGEGVSIRNVDQLHMTIGCFLATKKKVLSGNELRFLRKEMDLTQAELGNLVGLSDQQVARWEKDEYEIPGAADTLTRLYYLDHIKKVPANMRELIETLKNMDEQRRAKLIFEDTKQGWKPQLAA